ncbi:hypothetical protein GCM10017620_25870 [Brevundimonas intermedia]|uniref:Uncharacterized protein n=1 Tax=Brevundimonas intermedia TaxID=74315 RepID=A0ABQ5T9Z0_9CAUL|nr:hypothetical protein GCM10017620_25870 [Brevundimonas intermedia]
MARLSPSPALARDAALLSDASTQQGGAVGQALDAGATPPAKGVSGLVNE